MAAPSSLLDTDSEEELPAGWEERSTTDGRVYYAKYVVLVIHISNAGKCFKMLENCVLSSVPNLLELHVLELKPRLPST